MKAVNSIKIQDRFAFKKLMLCGQMLQSWIHNCPNKHDQTHLIHSLGLFLDIFLVNDGEKKQRRCSVQFSKGQKQW